MKRLLILLLLLPSLAWGGDIEIARMNPYILGGGVAGGSSGCSYSFSALDADVTSDIAAAWRIPVAASTLGCSGTSIRITLEAHSSSNSIISGTSVGEQAAQPEDFTAVPTRITWDTGSNGKTISAGTTATSDWVSYTWTDGNVHLIHIYMEDNGTQYIRRKNTSGTTLWYDSPAASDTTLEAVFTEDGTTANKPFITKIEVK